MSDTAPAATGTDPAEAPATGAEGEAETEGGSEPTVGDLLAQIEDLKANSRKWEDRSKANKEKADKFDAAERARMTDAERASTDVKAAHEERDTAIRERDEALAELARYKVISEFGLDAEDAKALAAVSDEAALRSLAERLAGRSSGPKPNPAQGKGNQPVAMTPGQAFADALSDLF